MYTASFYGDYEEYPRYSVGDVYPTQRDALLACEADLREKAMAGRKYYNDLCYYEITEELEDGERGDTVNAAELPALTLPNLGDFVRFMPRRKALNGVIIAVKADDNYRCFWVAELLKNGQPSTDGRRRWLYHLRDLNKVMVYRRFTPLTPTENGPTWERVVVPLK